VNGIDKILAADLADMHSFSRFNLGVKYVLTVIDAFSKFGWVLPLKDKTGVSVTNALKEIFKQRKPDRLWTDKGKGFYNKHVNALGVELYSTKNKEKSRVVERRNRKMKEKMSEYFTPNNTNKYIDVFDEFVDKYNNTRHTSIKMTPVETSKQTSEVTVYRNLYPEFERRPIRTKFKIGDKVRILKKKGLFEKGFTPNWTEEVSTVSKIQRTDPITLTITDVNVEEIQGTFFEQELQKTTQEVFRIEKVVKKVMFEVWLNGKGIQQVSTLGSTTKNLLNCNTKCEMKNKVLESKAQQSLRF